jgi:hypothetical protein
MKTNGLFQPLPLATVLAAGFVVVWGLLGLWAVEVGTYVADSEGHAEYLEFLPDGTPFVRYLVGRGDWAYRDLEGNPVPPPEDGTMTWLGKGQLPAALPDRVSSGDTAWGERIRSFADGRTPAVFWYFVSDGRPNGAGYFVGYDSQSKGCVGYLGRAGFRADLPPADEQVPFAGPTWGAGARVYCHQHPSGPTEHPADRGTGRAPHGAVSGWDVYVLGRDGKLYHADLQNRTVHVALDEPGLRSAGLVRGPLDVVKGTLWRLAARTEDAVLLLDERGTVLKRFPIPEALRGREVAFGETTGGEAVMYANTPFDEVATEVAYHICWVSPDGRCREAAVILPWAAPLRSMQAGGALVVPSPLVLAGLIAVERTRELLSEGLAATFPEALARALTEFRPALLIAQLVSAGLALLCYRRQVRYGARGAERVAWPLFVLVLGLPGWVGYRFGRSWPALAACPACGTAAPQDRDGCARCTAEFPPPALRGTEVFA